ATDASLSSASLERVARRAGLGLARTGSVAHHGSGEIFVAFSTSSGQDVEAWDLDPFFEATVDATEEAVLNAMWAAPDVEGRTGRRRSSSWRVGCQASRSHSGGGVGARMERLGGMRTPVASPA